jgi:hypothetical protein
MVWLVGASQPVQRFDWSTADLSYIGEAAKEYDASRKLCASVIHAEPTMSDLPTAAEAAELKDLRQRSPIFRDWSPS